MILADIVVMILTRYGSGIRISFGLVDYEI